MNCPKAVSWALAASLTLGPLLGLPARAASPSPRGSSILPKAAPEQLALTRLTACGLGVSAASEVLEELETERQLELLQALGGPAWLDYLSFAFSWPERLDRYEAYHLQNPDLSPEEAVVQVNIGLDTSPYTEPETVEKPWTLTALVNQYHALPQDYVPRLVALDAVYTNQQDSLRPEAYRAFVRMVDAAAEDGIRLYNVSAYRSYTTQKWVYQRYVNQDGSHRADTYSARPGCSEHQTGLALDVNTASLRDHFEETNEYAWLVEHAGEFGFILRFPEGKEEITGYQFEPWHYRYVGTRTARLCWEMDWTLEEFHARQSAPGRR